MMESRSVDPMERKIFKMKTVAGMIARDKPIANAARSTYLRSFDSVSIPKDSSSLKKTYVHIQPGMKNMIAVPNNVNIRFREVIFAIHLLAVYHNISDSELMNCYIRLTTFQALSIHEIPELLTPDFHIINL